MAGGHALDPPVQALQDQLGPFEDVAHDLVREPGPARRDPALHLVEVEPNLTVVDLVAEGLHIAAGGPLAPVPLDEAVGEDGLRHLQEPFAHLHRVANPSSRTAQAEPTVVKWAGTR